VLVVVEMKRYGVLKRRKRRRHVSEKILWTNESRVKRGQVVIGLQQRTLCSGFEQM
jgi:hypothetical protein